MLKTSGWACVAFSTLSLLATPGYAGGRPDDSSRSWFGQVAGGILF